MVCVPSHQRAVTSTLCRPPFKDVKPRCPVNEMRILHIHTTSSLERMILIQCLGFFIYIKNLNVTLCVYKREREEENMFSGSVSM